MTGLERLIKYGNDYQNMQSSSQVSLFGGSNASFIPEPSMPDGEEYPLIEKLKYEKDLIGIYLTGHPLDNYKFELEKFCNATVKDLKLIQQMKNKEGGDEVIASFNELKRRTDLCVGGLLSNVQHKMTKTGNPFGTFMLEDYNDSYEFALFGEDYIKFKNLMFDGYFLQVRGTIEEKFRQKDNWDLRVSQMVLLSELRDKLTKSITISLNLNEICSDLLNDLQGLVEANNQKYAVKNCMLRFQVKDKEEAIAIEMPSRNFKINPADDFIDSVKELTKNQPQLN